jgi:hypothetical protein
MAGVGFTTGSGELAAMDKVGTATAPATDDRIPYVKIDRGTDGSSDPVDEDSPLPVGDVTEVISTTLTLDTAAYAAGDLIADAQAVTGLARSSGQGGVLVDLLVIDEDDQGVAIDIYLTQVSTSWGSENAAPTITDSVARSIQAIIPVAAADYKDLGGVKVAHIKNIQAVYETSGSADMYVAVVSNASTPTYTASGVRLKWGVRQN